MKQAGKLAKLFFKMYFLLELTLATAKTEMVAMFFRDGFPATVRMVYFTQLLVFLSIYQNQVFLIHFQTC